jgi:hypothetical protein
VEEKRTHLNLKVRPNLKAELERRARVEKRSLGNLAEVLLDWSAEQLHAAGDTVSLLRAPGIRRSKRVSQETQEQLFTAIGIILARAPSTVIEEVCRKLSRYAAQYGETK